MITEQSIKDRCTPEIITQMSKLAEGFKIDENIIIIPTGNYFHIYEIISSISGKVLFPLLIHRAVEGWNKLHKDQECIVIDDIALYQNRIPILFKNYQVEILTQAECACLDCLIELIGRNKND